MANDARRKKEEAGRARLRAGYAQLASDKAERGLVRDVSLREPVKKGRFGTPGALRFTSLFLGLWLARPGH